MQYATHPIDDDGWTEWIKPDRGYRMRCCECRLVHEVEFKVGDDGAVRMRVRRHERATAASRRKRK